MAIHQIHITTNTDVWEVSLNGSSEGRFDTQYEASSFARRLAYQIGGAQISVHGPDGRIREKNTISAEEPRNTPA
ncbi:MULTISPECIES: DUF2188 domain-containing protein [Actinomycetes]|uniref:DUF2188 domain-containing protein n=1 Tax=Actinomycetes TaxID=1760 RepID=UPI00343DFE8A